MDRFTVGLSLSSDDAIVGVSGDVDSHSAPTLGGVLELAVRQDGLRVVLDLGDLRFMSAAGLGVIAATCADLGATGRLLTLRAAPAMTLRLLDLTGMTHAVRFESPEPASTGLGAEEVAGDRSTGIDRPPTDIALDISRISAGPANNDVVDAALRLVTSLAQTTVDGADGVSVTLERHGRLGTVAASDDTIRRMDAHQYETGEGPCLAAAAEGHWFHAESLQDETRWPSFTPLAIEEGVASILSSPLLVGDRPLGALNIYSHTDQAFGAEQQELAALFAAQASGILLDAGADVTLDRLTERTAAALHAREVIAQAQGVLMASDHVSARDAAVTLHRTARSAGTTVLARAAEIVAATLAEVGPDSTETDRG